MSVEILSRLTAAFGMRKWLRHRGRAPCADDHKFIRGSLRCLAEPRARNVLF